MSELGLMYGAALRSVISALENLKDEDLAKLTDPAFHVEIKITRRRSKEDAEAGVTLDLAGIVTKLTAFSSRNEASSFLSSTFETKKPLEQIARHLDIPIIKQDKVETLRDKIIEATTGARIRSVAIKGAD